MDVIAIIKVRLNNWCDPEDLAADETLLQLTQQLLRDEDILQEVDEFEVLAADYAAPQQLPLPEVK